MASEYAKVMRALGQPFVAAGHGEIRAASFQNTWGVPTGCGPLEEQLRRLDFTPETAIIAGSAGSLAESSILLAKAGARRLLIEKPAALDPAGARQLALELDAVGTEAYVGYNRRFYASVRKACELIEEDGGALSLKFDFTEACARIEALDKPKEDLQSWFYGNSTHVLDTAFYLTGRPVSIRAQRCGSLLWHPAGAVFTGHGTTEHDVPFSYHADWIAPGRWGVEVMTAHRRLVLQPMEQLYVQDHRSFTLREIPLNNELDNQYKPGLYRQVSAFLATQKDSALLPIKEHAELFSRYAVIRDGGSMGPLL